MCKLFVIHFSFQRVSFKNHCSSVHIFFLLYEVDGQVKCEKWIRDDNSHSEESKATWWLPRLMGRKHKITLDWPYPFTEGRLFVLTLTAGLEGYHVSVDGKHVTSFPYRTVCTIVMSTSIFERRRNI
jgi:hypothetical protein